MDILNLHIGERNYPFLLLYYAIKQLCFFTALIIELPLCILLYFRQLPIT